MRGKGPSPHIPPVSLGITPAYAGKRGKSPAIFRGYQDHPRLCGEKGKTVQPAGKYPGSPPPMRGKETAGISLII